MSASALAAAPEDGVLVAPITEADLAELSSFLIQGLPHEHGERLFAPDMLRWKFLLRTLPVPASFVARQEGRIVGHLGLALRTLCIPGLEQGAKPLLAAHIIDWLVTLKGQGAGKQLLRCGLSGHDLTYALGGSADAKRSGSAVGFMPREGFAVMRKVLRPAYRLRRAGSIGLRSLAAAGRDAARLCWPRMQRGDGSWRLRQVTTFGTEVAAINARFAEPQMHTERSAPLFNHLLACPGAEISGWLIEHRSQARGFALLNVVDTALGRFGRLIECQLDAPTQDSAWLIAIALLTDQLKAQGSDAVTCYASTPWLASACRSAGYHPERQQSVMVRDPRGLVPAGLPFLFSQLEADHALA